VGVTVANAKDTSGNLSPGRVSVAIALMALLLTFYTADLDRRYRELSIKPALYEEIDSGQFRVAVVNNGIGPAVITRVATKFGRECNFSTFDPRGSGDEQYVDTLLHAISDYFGDPLDQLVQRSVWEPTDRKIYSWIITPKEMISPGGSINLFQLQPEQLDLALKKLETLKTNDANDITARFIKRAHTIPYYVEYCSLSGDYCVGAETIHQACPSSALRFRQRLRSQ
jgi:hypothetical protein